ncbi:MAG: endonuclease domain-containing protein [Acidimicrobiales bacterium]|jgi:hypothetical protein
MDAQPRFDPGSVETFRVVDRTFDPTTRTARLRYAFDDGRQFEETVTFETPPTGPVPPPGESFERALLHLHIAAGTSYYKAAAPPIVDVEGTALTGVEREFHRRLYDDGLREFAVTNGMAVPRPVEIRSAGQRAPSAPPTSPARTGGLVVPIGGGKDSMVLIEAVRSLRPRLFAVNPHPLTVALAEETGLELLVVRRRLSPELLDLNRRGALNGHVPITAIVSLIAVAGSFLYGYDAIAMAVERSASEETVLVDGVPVNHQFSKSLEFEWLLTGLVTGSIDPGLVYGSALRPYSELAIGRAFAGLERYHGTFCSCNAAFRQGAAPEDRWCGHCPKCRFVALVLAPFMSPETVAAIIGRDLFADPSQVAGFAALMSDEDKPFECVGERRESAVALRLLSELPAWRQSVVVTALAGRARSLVSEADVVAALTPAARLDYPDPEVAAAVAALLTGAP